MRVEPGSTVVVPPVPTVLVLQAPAAVLAPGSASTSRRRASRHRTSQPLITPFFWEPPGWPLRSTTTRRGATRWTPPRREYRARRVSGCSGRCAPLKYQRRRTSFAESPMPIVRWCEDPVQRRRRQSLGQQQHGVRSLPLPGRGCQNHPALQVLHPQLPPFQRPLCLPGSHLLHPTTVICPRLLSSTQPELSALFTLALV